MGYPADEIVTLLRRRGETLAVAESLTGGALAAAIVDVPGASQVFRGGLVVYATDLKTTLAGVPAGLVDQRGPVHPDVAAALAEGARKQCGATWGIGTTGVAGPEAHGGQPPGTVWLAVAGPDLGATKRLRLSGGRAQVRAASVVAALQLLARQLRV